MQLLLLILNEGYLHTTTIPDLQREIAPLGPPAPTQPQLLGLWVAPPGHRPWPQAPSLASGVGCSSRPLPAALNMPANLENSAVATGLEKSAFIPIPKKGNAKECSNYRTIALISHASKVMLKILQTRLQ